MIGVIHVNLRRLVFTLLAKLSLVFGHDSKLLMVVNQVVDIDLASPDAFNYLFLYVLNVGLASSFDFNLMGGDNLHFVFVELPLVQALVIGVVVALVVGIALGAALTDCQVFWLQLPLIT